MILGICAYETNKKNMYLKYFENFRMLLRIAESHKEDVEKC
jgi:hypothetical protein